MTNSAVKHVVQKLTDEQQAHNQTKLERDMYRQNLAEVNARLVNIETTLLAIDETMTKKMMLGEIKKALEDSGFLPPDVPEEDNPNTGVPSDLPF